MLSSQAAATPSNAIDRDLTHIATALAGIRYGSIEIVIHDSRIVQIERKEKVRFERDR
jgi:hypothetical protein